ncbi:hypothetical protein C8J57DRAFT_1594319 [Mycena rebaudengoi]|nr:hypothetical protein C8J57DRAFT_1594319 [Mycena rebaudengoi]
MKEREPAHDPNCMCQDPNARLNKSTIAQALDFEHQLDPTTLTPDQVEKSATQLLQYLQSCDIPPEDHGCCAHTLGFAHAHIALRGLRKLMRVGDERFFLRLVAEWPEIQKWLEYVFTLWIRSGMFEGQQNLDRSNGFHTVVPFLRSVSQIPQLRDLLVALRSIRHLNFAILSFCWQMEGADWFREMPKYDPSFSAAEPLVEMAQANSDDFFTVFPIITCPAAELTAAALAANAAPIARIALGLLKIPSLSLPLPVLEAHVKMITILSRETAYSGALLSQNSIRDVTRVLSALTSNRYDPVNAEKTGNAIRSCLEYLLTALPKRDGFTSIIIALRGGILQSMIRCNSWIAPETEAHDKLLQILHLISLYTIYPSVIRQFLSAVSNIDQLGILAATQPFCAAYLKVVHLMIDRRTLPVQPIDLAIRCEQCHKPDGDFKTCSACSIPTYCSEACQKAHWVANHKKLCKNIEELRKKNEQLRLLTEDLEYACEVTMSEVSRRRADIVRVWKAEMPERNPLVSFDYTVDPRGVMVVGEQCFHTLPSGQKLPAEDTRDLLKRFWGQHTQKEFHREHIIVGIFLPRGEEFKEHCVWIGIDPQFTEGTVVERLIKTIECFRPCKNESSEATSFLEGQSFSVVEPLNLKRKYYQTCPTE